MSMVERTTIRGTREADAVVGRVRVTGKNNLKITERLERLERMVEPLLNIPEIQAWIPKGCAAIRQFDALDREAEEIVALTPDKRRHQESRLRQINNERYPQLAVIAERLGNATRHNQPAHIGKFINDDRQALRRLREDGVGSNNDERIPGIGRTRGQLLVKLEAREAEAAKGHEYQDRLHLAAHRLAEIELSGAPIDVNAELTKLVNDLGEPPFPCCPPITLPGAI